MEAVKAFNAELSSLYEVKPPISKAKMTALTRGAIKAIKFYKHVVQSVEKFILKCKPEYKVPGLYVIDSIVRQSRHQFGSDKDVFASRFSKNIQQTFINLFKCPAEDKSKIIRVLNLWQKNQVFPPEVIQPLFDFADPNNPIYKELGTPIQQSTNGLNVSSAAIKGSPALQRTPTKGNQPGNESGHGSTSSLNLTDPNVLQQLQQLQRLLTKSTDSSTRSESQVHFDKKLLDFDYGDEEDEVNPSPRPQANANDSVTSLLTNPEVLRQLQTLQQTMSGVAPEMDMDKMRKLQEMKQQEDEFDKHLAQTVPNLPFASECEFKPGNNQIMGGYFISEGMNPPAPNYQMQEYEIQQQQNKNSSQDNGPDVEVITLDHDDSRSPSPSDDRYSGNRRRRSRSRSRDRGRRDRDRDRRRRSRSRSRSGTRRHRSRSRERDRNRLKEKKEEKETEKDRERKKRGLPAIKKDHLSVCSTTLWVGHLSKLVHQDDLSNTFGEFGDVVSIDLIPPRGCAFIVMLRRQDAARCLGKLKGHVLHGKAITLAWAPGKGVKGKDLKDYWEGDLGVSYIPYTKIKDDIDIEMLEDGGMIDEDTTPDWMKEKMERMGKKTINLKSDIPSFVIGGDVSNTSSTIDTSQPPPMPGAGLLQPPLLPLVSPFQFNNRLLGMNVPPNMMTNMPNIPIGVPPPNMPAPMMPNQLLGMGSPFQGPPGMLPPQMSAMDNKPNPPSTESNLHSLSESLMNITQPFGMIPQPPAPHDDNMDVEMEDAEKHSDKQLPLSEQLQQMAGHYGRTNRDDDRRDRREERDNRSSRSRDRDRDRDRGRERHSSRDRDRDRRDRDNSRGRDKDRRDDRRERNRWGDKDRERERRDIREPENRDDKREREKNLNDRLRKMAGMGGFEEPNRPPRDTRNSENGSRIFPQSVPPQGLDCPPNKPDEEFMRGHPLRGQPRGPPMMDMPPILDRPSHMEVPPGPPPMVRGPPDIMRDGPSDMMSDNGLSIRMDNCPPEIMMDGPLDALTDGPPDIPPHMRMDGPPLRMHPRADMEPDRFMRGGRRDFDPRGIRGPPGSEFFPRDDFVPRGPPPPVMRGGPDFGPRGPDFGPRVDFGPRGPDFGPRGPDFGPRGADFSSRGLPMMGPRGPRGQFFGPRGPRGPRVPFRDGPNFNTRFDGPPEFFRGPGPRMPPPMFDGPPLRHRGPRFDDRRRGRPGFDFNPEYIDRGPGGPPDRTERRSRWGGSPVIHEEVTMDCGELPVAKEQTEDNRNGATTPVRDECPSEAEPVQEEVPLQECSDVPPVEETVAE